MAEQRNPKLLYVRDVPFPKVLRKKNLEAIMDMTPDDDDVIIASYPKTGSTLLQYIVLQIISRGDCYPSMDDLSCHFTPIIDMIGVEALDLLTKPRIYKSHLPHHVVQKNEKAKYLYTYRKPEDTFASYYRYFSEISDEEYDFDRFFNYFLLGHVPYGGYLEHVLSIFARRDHPNVLLISYEKLVKNRREEILRIAKFLGEEYYQDLAKDESTLQGILERTSFDYMRRNLFATKPQLLMQGRRASSEDEKVNFFRKGVMGHGTEVLTAEHLQKLKDFAAEAVNGTDLFEEWFGNQK